MKIRVRTNGECPFGHKEPVVDADTGVTISGAMFRGDIEQIGPAISGHFLILGLPKGAIIAELVLVFSPDLDKPPPTER